MDRRQFLQYSTAAAATLALPSQWVQARPKADVKRWRGFNLLNYFSHWGPFPFKEEEFKWISDWGFNYVPMCAYPFLTGAGPSLASTIKLMSA